MQLEQKPARLVLPPLVAVRRPLFDHGNAGARPQFAHRGRKIDVLILHDEAKYASARAAAETMKGLPLRADMERRRFFLMKRAECPEIRPGAFEREIRTDHVDDVVGGRHLLDGL